MYADYYDRICICRSCKFWRRTPCFYFDGQGRYGFRRENPWWMFSFAGSYIGNFNSGSPDFGEDLLLVFGASENTIEYATEYLNIYAVGTVFVQLTLGMNAFVTAQGFTKVSMVSVAIGAILNIVLDPILFSACTWVLVAQR